jgi:hypothetical protein
LDSRSHRSAQAALIALVWLVAVVPASSFGEEAALSNLDLMTSLSRQVVDRLIDGFGPEVTGKAVRLAPFMNSEEYLFLENVFSRALDERRIRLVEPAASGAYADADSVGAFVVEFQAMLFDLHYPKAYRAYLFGGKRVKREARVRIFAKLVSPRDGSVVWLGEEQAERTDQFSYGDIGRVQEGSFEFVKAEVPKAGWGKVLEPVFVSAIVVGMIYLFFSNQSDS